MGEFSHDPVPADGDALVREALAKHPQLLQANIHLQLAENGRRTARAALLPTVAVQGGREFNGETLGAQQSSWVMGAEVRVNLFADLRTRRARPKRATLKPARPPSANAWSDASNETCAGHSRNSPPRAHEKRRDAQP